MAHEFRMHRMRFVEKLLLERQQAQHQVHRSANRMHASLPHAQTWGLTYCTVGMPASLKRGAMRRLNSFASMPI